MSLLISASILSGCGSQTGSIVAIPPTTATIQPSINNVSLKPLFCDEASHFHWDGGSKTNPTLDDVNKVLQRNDATVDDLRELLGDTDETILQAKTINAIGVKLCGWH